MVADQRHRSARARRRRPCRRGGPGSCAPSSSDRAGGTVRRLLGWNERYWNPAGSAAGPRRRAGPATAPATFWRSRPDRRRPARRGSPANGPPTTAAPAATAAPVLRKLRRSSSVTSGTPSSHGSSRDPGTITRPSRDVTPGSAGERRAVTPGRPGRSLDGDRLGQVARLVDVVAPGRGHLAGEHLQRHRGHQRLQQGRRRRDRGSGGRRTGSTASSPSSAITMVRAPRARTSWMLETILSCSTPRPARRRHHDDDRQALLDQRDRAVLELAGGEALGVHVGELLELERALQRHRVADVPAEEQHRASRRRSSRASSRTGSMVVQHLRASCPASRAGRRRPRAISSPYLVPRTWAR